MGSMVPGIVPRREVSAFARHRPRISREVDRRTVDEHLEARLVEPHPQLAPCSSPLLHASTRLASSGVLQANSPSNAGCRRRAASAS